jgi:hypothetical protein
MADVFSLSTEDRSELFCLVDSALQIASLSEVPKLQDEIAAKMNFGWYAIYCLIVITC